MERTQFVDVTGQSWWLVQPDLDPTLETKRQELATSWGWVGDASWHTDAQKLAAVYEWLEGSRPDLLQSLDSAEDTYQRQQWIDEVVAARAAAAAASAPASVASTADADADAAEAEERESEQAVSEAEAPAAPKKPSLFARKATAPAEADAESVERGGDSAAERAEPVDPAALHDVEVKVESFMNQVAPSELEDIAKQVGLSVDEIKKIVEEPEFLASVLENMRES